VISGNRIHDNNTEGFEPGWESGGIKIKTSNSVIVEGNEVYSNAGNGIWCDISCANATIRNNVVHDNLGIGIFFEISDGAEIAGNHVWENAWVGSVATRTWAYEAGILISSASNANVHDNVVAWNGDGIAVISQCRAYLASGTCDLGHPWNNVHGNTVHDNVIVVADDPRAPYNVFALAWLRDTTDGSGGPYTYMYSAQAGNSGSANRYWIPQPEGSTKVGFSWGDTHTSSLAAFNATPGEEGGSYLSDAERDQILAGAGMPTAPASHASEQSGSTLAWANGSSVAWFQDDRTRIRQLGKHKRAGRS
jgi:parallel beta-helix repeat protein